MKKLFTAISAVALAASMSVTALAANSTTNNGTTGSDITVTGRYQASAESGDVISVDITWDDMTFEYTEGEKVWNPATHKYDRMPGTWGKTPKYIRTTNNSNVDLKIKVSAKGEGDITFNFGDTIYSAPSADGLDTPYTTSDGLVVESGSITESGKIGTVTVGIFKADAIMSDPDLRAALENGGDITVDDNMILGTNHETKNSTTTNLDLSGKTLTFKSHIETLEMTFTAWGEGTVLNLKNGEINGAMKYIIPLSAQSGAVVNAENCTFSTGVTGTAIEITNPASVNLKNCTVAGNIEFLKDSYAEGTGTLTLSGSIVLDGEFIGLSENGKVVCLAGTYNFDPMPYIDADYYSANKDEETGLWKVIME